MRVPDQLLKCAVFLGEDRGTNISWGATGFILAIESERFPGRLFPFIATAGHTAKRLEGVPFRVRANLHGGGYREFEGDGRDWVHHPDARVDAAVCPWSIPPDVDIVPIIVGEEESGLGLTVNAQQMARLFIGIGDDVVIVGLFAKHFGTKQNLPLVRSGTLSMLPDEPIDNGSKGQLWGYLIEARSIGGLSGSPVFVSQTMWIPNFQPAGGSPDGAPVVGRIAGPLYFLGLMHGHWDIDPLRLNEPATKFAPDGVNLGIAIVVPSEKICEILNVPELVEMRKKVEDEMAREQGTTTSDSGFTKKPGPEPERLVIDDKWERAVKRALQNQPKKPKDKR